jgi:hypothetical protein
MVWDIKIAQYRCNKCDEILTEKDKVVQVQFGYLLDKGQSFEDSPNIADQHYHFECYKTGDR